ncbi:hypothetical protein EU538_03650 [Candidatus Thorarchaeota archaeon]|nr:MAG: hypothetical protein EU538_03650 [Candidatus Thorarchaeota archaeon]
MKTRTTILRKQNLKAQDLIAIVVIRKPSDVVDPRPYIKRFRGQDFHKWREEVAQEDIIYKLSNDGAVREEG